MNKKSLLILLLLVSCQSKIDERSALLTKKADELIASSEERITTIKYSDSPLTKEDQHRLDRFYPQTLEKIYKNQRLQAQDIIHMTRAGVADGVIIEIIESTHSLFYLSPEDEKELEQAGVSKKVISIMMTTTDTRY